MLSVSNRLAQQLLGADFSTGFTSQKQSTGVLCEVLKLVLSLDTIVRYQVVHLSFGSLFLSHSPLHSPKLRPEVRPLTNTDQCQTESDNAHLRWFSRQTQADGKQG